MNWLYKPKNYAEQSQTNWFIRRQFLYRLILKFHIHLNIYLFNFIYIYFQRLQKLNENFNLFLTTYLGSVWIREGMCEDLKEWMCEESVKKVRVFGLGYVRVDVWEKFMGVCE